MIHVYRKGLQNNTSVLCRSYPDKYIIYTYHKYYVNGCK